MNQHNKEVLISCGGAMFLFFWLLVYLCNLKGCGCCWLWNLAATLFVSIGLGLALVIGNYIEKKIDSKDRVRQKETEMQKIHESVSGRVAFWGQRAYDCSGKPLKPVRNILRELGYTHVTDHKGLRRLVPLRELSGKNKG